MAVATALPGKSGIVAIPAGMAGISAFSPLLSPAGNSVRRRFATAHLSRQLELNIFPTCTPRRTSGRHDRRPIAVNLRPRSTTR
ncbi:glutaminase [Catellatospora coxensis]|uniref:glutaminase n=1 Tax=Catellatospora coxensis TaxID=310354 RepID=UPI001942C1F7